MRSIPSDLKQKIEKAQQTIFQNADPKMNIFVTKSRWQDLFNVFTIHNDTGLSRLDTTVKRETAEGEPNKAYTIYIKDGMAHVKSKPLPYDELTPWDYEFQVGLAEDVAIEFDGEWQRDFASKRFNFVADEKPFIFWQSGGVLKGNYWNQTFQQTAESTWQDDFAKGTKTNVVNVAGVGLQLGVAE
jgi:hypothetical protein